MSIEAFSLSNPSQGHAGRPPQRSEHLLLACRNLLDRDALGYWLRSRGGFVNLRTTCDWDYGIQGCLSRPVDLIIVDPLIGSFDLAKAMGVMQSGRAQHLLVLDDCLREGRLTAVLNAASVSYVTRQAGAAEILRAMDDVLNYGRRVFDPSVAGRIRRTRRGLQLSPSPNDASVAQLTHREIEVMLLLARGATVRDAAKVLSLSESTVDNHRSRLMKKLNVHKATELTRRAIRDGLMVE